MTNCPPNFFRFTDAAIGDPRVPLVENPDVRLGEEFCSGCGARRTPRLGVSSCSIKRGTAWTDVIGNPSWSLRLFSGRVLRGLSEIGATGFSASPVRITNVHSKRLRASPEPTYYYFDVTGRIDVDHEASGLGGVTRCPVCFQILGDRHPEARRFVPVEERWDGSDLFRLRNQPNSMMFCTHQVLELARRDRWTNFRFEPMDLERRHIAMWGGIDYLGPEWPPKQWYPTPPSAGKSLDEWVQLLQSEDFMQKRAARIALSDLDEEAIPPLTALLDGPSDLLRNEAAQLLLDVNRRVPLSPGLKERVRTLLPPESLKFLH